MQLGGMDEAGRGPVLGPLVVAGVAVLDPELPASLGCTDSKRLSPDRRRALDRELRKSAGVRIAVRRFEADELDRRRRAGATLTTIELEAFGSIAHELGAATVIVDAAHPSEGVFAELLRPRVPAACALRSEHKADLNHPVVGAASIVAKVARDKAVAALARRLERQVAMPIGSGYPSDPDTRAFLLAWHREFKAWPDGTRLTWSTLRELLAPRPTRLEMFDADAALRAADAAADRPLLADTIV